MNEPEKESMRYAVVPATALLDNRLSLRDVSVLGALGIHTDKQGWCTPSQGRIGAMLGISRHTVAKSVAVLRECGYLVVSARRGDGGGQTSNLMRVVMDLNVPETCLRYVPKNSVSPMLAPATPEVAAPATPEVAAPATPEVAAPATPEVAAPATPEVAAPATPEVAAPATPEVAAPATPEVAAPATPEVARNPPLKSPTEQHTPLTPTGGGEDDELFAGFWKVYPRKVGKDAARKAFAKRKPDAELLAKMLAAVARQAQSEQWRKKDGQFIPHPTTWLNRGQWEDGEGAAQGGDSESRPQWALQAGFENRWEAENERCFAHNAHLFRDGRRMEVPA
ncbi:helix-turn-helix domain-containing protein [Delftia lacustris]|uniref:Helix-turn-helix domain-containing protein n=3 Tax=Delftia TaxID=80865 RepID=A0A7T3DBC3_9BURK|nr:helix-turn-helix domain-containing protein [Delftia lacustris]